VRGVGRRSFVRGAAAALCLGLAAAPVSVIAQDARPIRIVVPAPPGGNLDATARMLAHRLTLLTGEPHVVDNRPGASTQIGTELVVRAPADGRVMLYHGTSVVFMSLLQKVGFSPLQDLAPVIQVSRESYVLAAGTGGPGSIEDLEAQAAARPGGLNCVTPPGATELACQQLKARLGGQLTVVPFPGVAPALNALVAGWGDVMFVNAAAAAKLVENGRIRVLAVSSRMALPAAAAQAPLLSQRWPGFLLEGHSGLFVPARTPQARIRQLNADVARILADPEVGGAMREGGQEVAGGSTRQFDQVLRRAHQRYGEIIRSLDLAVK